MTTNLSNDVKPVTIASKQAVVDNLLKDIEKDKPKPFSKEKRELTHENLPQLMR